MARFATVWDIYGELGNCLGHIWRAWQLFGIYMASVATVSDIYGELGNCFGHIWRAWQLFGTYMESLATVWDIYGELGNCLGHIYGELCNCLGYVCVRELVMCINIVSDVPHTLRHQSNSCCSMLHTRRLCRSTFFMLQQARFERVLPPIVFFFWVRYFYSCQCLPREALLKFS